MEASEIKYSNIFASGRYSGASQFFDARLRTEDGCTFEVHRVMLTRSSKYFRALFCRINTDTRELLIPGISGECLSDILCYVYTEEITISERNVEDLLIGADYLLLDDLYLKIKTNITGNITDSNCWGIFEAARLISDEKISNWCYRYIQTRFELMMLKQPRCHTNLPLEILRIILSDRNLCVSSEETVWQAIEEWTSSDIPSRMYHVPCLLHSLAVKELDEKLAWNILNHKIVFDNPFFIVATSKIIASNECNNYLDLLLEFLSNSDLKPSSYRTPKELYVIASHGKYITGSCKLYITYDENLDLWCKIAENTNETIDLNPNCWIVIGHNIYTCSVMDGICRKFDLSTAQWMPMELFTEDYYLGASFAVVDTSIYMFGELYISDLDTEVCGVEVYDTTNDTWYEGIAPPGLKEVTTVAIEKKIYAVGHNNDRMMAQVFDSVTQQWSLLSPPLVHRSEFALVAYQKNIYVIGGSTRTEGVRGIADVEVFYPSTNVWRKLQDLPFTYKSIRAQVLKDVVVVYDRCWEDDETAKHVCWNDTEECWEIMERSNPLKEVHRHIFCSIKDEETIKLITKRNRNPEIEFERSPFNL